MLEPFLKKELKCPKWEPAGFPYIRRILYYHIALATSILPALLLSCWLCSRLKVTEVPDKLLPVRCYVTGTIFNLKPKILLYNPQNQHSNVFSNCKMSWKWQLCTQIKGYFLDTYHISIFVLFLEISVGSSSLFHLVYIFYGSSNLSYFSVFWCSRNIPCIL